MKTSNISENESSREGELPLSHCLYLDWMDDQNPKEVILGLLELL